MGSLGHRCTFTTFRSPNQRYKVPSRRSRQEVRKFSNLTTLTARSEEIPVFHLWILAAETWGRRLADAENQWCGRLLAEFEHAVSTSFCLTPVFCNPSLVENFCCKLQQRLCNAYSPARAKSEKGLPERYMEGIFVLPRVQDPQEGADTHLYEKYWLTAQSFHTRPFPNPMSQSDSWI